MYLYKRIYLIIASIGIAILLLFSGHLLINWLTCNFHPVIIGKVYRSAQLTPNQLADYTTRYQLKTILNLRGVFPKAPWYQQEVDFVKQHPSVHLINLQLSAHQLPSATNLNKLVTLLENSPKPILIHCKYGADRTGLAAAISVILADNPSLNAAEQQISWRYNVLSPSSVGYQVLFNYITWLKKTHQPYGKSSFITWLHQPKLLKKYYGILID